MRPCHGSVRRLAVASAIAVATPVSAAEAASPTSAALPDYGAANTCVDSNERLAPTIETATGFGHHRRRAVRASMVAAINVSAREDLGPFSKDRGRRLARTNYVEARDIGVYVVGAGNGQQVIAVPRHDVVLADGSVRSCLVEDQNAVSRPIFRGPWGDEFVRPYVVANVDNGGWRCNNTYARNRVRLIIRKLRDTSRANAYYGVTVSGVAEIYNGADNCDDYIDTFGIGFLARSSGSQFVDQSPVSDLSGGCRSHSLSVGGAYGGVNMSLSRSFQKCEKYDIQGGNAATGWYRSVYDNNGACGAESRESALTAVVRKPETRTLAFTTYHTVAAGNQPVSWQGCHGH